MPPPEPPPSKSLGASPNQEGLYADPLDQLDYIMRTLKQRTDESLRSLLNDSFLGTRAATKSAPIQGSDMTKETEAQIAASEARSETKIARLEGKIDTWQATMSAQLTSLVKEVEIGRTENRDTRLVLIAVIVGAAFALAALIVGMATYGDALFGRGMDVRDLIQTIIRELPAAPATKP